MNTSVTVLAGFCLGGAEESNAVAGGRGQSPSLPGSRVLLFKLNQLLISIFLVVLAHFFTSRTDPSTYG